MTSREPEQTGDESVAPAEENDSRARGPFAAALHRAGLGFLTGTRGIIFAALVFSLGSVAGAYLDEFIRSIDTDFFGPSLEELLEQEKIDENFAAIQEKLDLLSSASSAEDLAQLKSELLELVDRQREYIAYLQRQAESFYSDNSRTKSELLKGVAPQSDFSLETNRAVTLGMRGNIFSTLEIYDDDSSRIRVNLNGSRRILSPGDQLEFSTQEEHCIIGYVSGSRARDTTRFNLTCSPG